MSEFKNLQPDVCDLIEPPEPPPKLCPTCKPDPSYIEPTWWLTEEAYLNKKTCEYQINMISAKSVAGLTENEVKYEAQKMVLAGIKAIIRQAGKLETNEIVCAFPPNRKGQKCEMYIPPNLLVKLDQQPIKSLEIINAIEYIKKDPDSRFNADSVEVAASVADTYYGDNFEIFQVLVSVPAENIDLLPESSFSNEDQEELEEAAEKTEEIILDGRSLRYNIRKIKAAFLLYGKYQATFAYTQNIKLSQLIDGTYVPFYIKKYRDRLDSFVDELRLVAKKNGFRLTGVNSRRTIDKVKIKIDKSNPLVIKSIWVKKKGCGYEKLSGTAKLKKTDKTTLSYLIKLDKMVEQLSFKGDDVPWLDFLAEHTYPALEIDFGDVDNNEESLNSCIDEESVQNFKDNILKGLLNFSEAIQFTLSTNECKTLEDIADNNPYERQRINLKESLKKKKEKRKEKINQRKVSREEIEQLRSNIQAAEEQFESAGSIEEIRQAIQDLQNSEASLAIANGNEGDAKKLFKQQIKVNNSIIRKLEVLIDELIGVPYALPQQELLIAELTKLKEENKQIKEQLDELKEIDKKLKKQKRQDRRKLTYDKLKDLVKEGFNSNRKDYVLIDAILSRKTSERPGFLLNSLNPCRWDGVSMQVIECLLGGMSFADAIPLIIKTALKNVSPYVLEDLLIGLPMEERKKVSDKVKKELRKVSQDLADNFKEPWETQREKDKEEETVDSSADNLKILDQNPPEVEVEVDYRQAKDDIAETKKQINKFEKQLKEKEKESEDIKKELSEYSKLENPIASIQMKIDLLDNKLMVLENEIEELTKKKTDSETELETQISDFKKSNKTATISLDVGQIAQIVFDAYIEAITNLLSIDRLTELIDQIPGAAIFKKLLIEITCPRVNPLKINIKDLFGSLSLDVCSPNAKDYFFPAIPKLISFRGIGLKFALKRMIEEFKDALVDLIGQLILALIIRILDLIENGLCNSIGVLGALLANALTGQKGKNGFLDAVNDAFCENEDSRKDTASDLLGKAGIPTNKRLEIGNALSSAATTNEIKQALVSECDEQNPKVMKAIWAVMNASDLNLNGMFQTPADVADMFCMMGSYLTDAQREAIRDSITQEDRPINPSICLTNQEREQWDNNRRNFYENQGLDPNAARDFVDGLNNKMNDDLANMLDSLAKGPDGILEDAIKEALEPRDPNCKDATNSIIPPTPEEFNRIMEEVADGVFGSLAYSFTKDMFGDGKSFFENILVDMRGIRLSYGLFSHERRVGFDLLFPNASNNAEEHAKKYDEAFALQKGVMRAISKGLGDPDPDHLFPLSVGLYLHSKFEEEAEKKFELSKTKPDLSLKFRNISTNEDLDFDFGFDLTYDHFIYDGEYKKTDTYTITKKDIVKGISAEEVGEDASRREKRKAKKNKKAATLITTDLIVEANHGVDRYPKQLEKYDVTESELSLPYVTQLFGNVIKERYSKIGATGISNKEIETMYNSLNSMIHKGLVKALITDPRQENLLPEGYLFGYSSDKITYEDLLYVNPNATDDPDTWEYTFEEEDAVLGKSATGNKRVKFLDPAIYGGKYTKPKVYVEQAKHFGWFRIAQTIVPELDGCDPRRSDFLFVSEVSQKVSKIQASIKADKRSEIEPSCIYEPAFDKFMSPTSHAYMEGIIMSTIRAYSLEAILRSMPIVSHLKLDQGTNYSDLFTSFIVDKMQDGMQEQGAWPRRIRDFRYWMLFLEQVVQSSFRMLERGDLPKDPELSNLLRQAVAVSKSYTRPTIDDKRILFLVEKWKTDSTGKIVDCEFKRGNISATQKTKTIKYLNALAFDAFGKDYKKELLKIENREIKFRTMRLHVLKEAEREYDVYENIDLAKKVLKFHVTQQLKFYGDKLEEAFTPQVYINNINKFLLGASKIPIVSNTEAGLSEIEAPVGDSALPNYGKIPSVPDDNGSPFGSVSATDKATALLTGGLFLQKYIRITPNEERTIDLEGMVSFKQFRKAIRDYSGDKTQYISDVFGNAVAIPELGTYEGTTGVTMGVRVCYLLPTTVDPFASSEERSAAKAAMDKEKAYYVNDSSGLKHFVPLAHFEQDIVDRTLEEINLNDENFDEDIKCYFDKMVETDEFKFIFNCLLITNKVPSIMAIYSYDGFINSLGLGTGEREEGKEGRNKNILGLDVGWEGRILDDTKKRLLNLFISYYLSRDDEKQKDRKDREKNDIKDFLGRLVPASLINFDRSVRWWQLRRLQDRPFDKDGKDCASTLASLFKGEE